MPKNKDFVCNLGRIDFLLLRRQKRHLFRIQDLLDEVGRHKLSDTIEGVLNLFDRIQDEAVRTEFETERRVFGKAHMKAYSADATGTTISGVEVTREQESEINA